MGRKKLPTIWGAYVYKNQPKIFVIFLVYMTNAIVDQRINRVLFPHKDKKKNANGAHAQFVVNAISEETGGPGENHRPPASH
jgi:hypothetical protein